MGEIFKWLLDKAAEIINAVQSPLALAALIVLVLGIVGVFLFRNSAGKLKLAAFAMITAGLLGLFIFASNSTKFDNPEQTRISQEQTEQQEDNLHGQADVLNAQNPFEARIPSGEIRQIQLALCVGPIDGQLGPPGSKTRKDIVDFFSAFPTPRPSINSSGGGLTPRDLVLLNDAINADSKGCVASGFKTPAEVGKSRN